MHGNKKDARERLQKEPVLLTFVLDSGLWNCEKMRSCTSLWNFAMGMLASGQCGSGVSGQHISPPAMGESGPA